MMAQTPLSRDLQKYHDQVWPLTVYEKNSNTRHWEYPWVISQVEKYRQKKRYNDLSIIEIGAANSCLQFYFSLKGVNYTSVDKSKKASDQRIARKLGVKINYQVGRFENINFTKNAFDLVICVSTMEHTKAKNERKILKNISRVLKRGSLAIFTIDWFFDIEIGNTCLWGRNLNCQNLIKQATKFDLAMAVGNKKYLSGYPQFSEKTIKKDPFILKVCNRGVWLTSQAFALRKE